MSLSDVAGDDLLVEWDYVKNGDVTPDTISAHSGRKVWWICSRGHSWEAMVSNRVRHGCGCPYCSGRLLIPGETDLATTHPDIVSDWDCEKNGDLKPSDVMAGTRKKVWWHCQRGHVFESSVCDYVLRNRGCPYCANKKILVGFNDLATTHPAVADGWDYEKNGDLTPLDVTSGSHRKVWWHCQRGHVFESSVRRHVSRKRGCPYCANKEILVGFNDLGTTHPDVAKGWDYEKNGDLTPERVSGYSGKKVWWLCDKGHSWQSIIYSRTSNGCGCPYCGRKQVLAGFNDLGTTHPEIAAEWDYEKNGNLTPSDVMAGTNKKAWWRCPLGHSYFSLISNRTSKHNHCGCPYCSGNKVLVGFNDLSTESPDIAAEWDYEKNGDLKPSNITSLTNKKVWWRCPSGHSYCAPINHRVVRGDGCPYCSGNKVLVGFNDLSTEYPDIAAEWDYEKNRDLSTEYPDIAAEWDYEKNRDLKPSDVTRGANRKVWWRCSSGHSYSCKIGNRVFLNRGCPYCAGRYVIAGVNDLATTHPDIASEWDYEKNGDLTPSDVMGSVNKKVWWRCSIGHSYYSSIGNRTSKYNNCGCPYCANKKVLIGFNDLATLYPDIASEWDYEKNGDLTPSSITSGSNRKVWWLCSLGHSYASVVASRTGRGSGCPRCAQSHGERFVEQYLGHTAAVWHAQWRDMNCSLRRPLPFDFAIFVDESSEVPVACIEYQGAQHYRSVDAFGGERSFKSQQKRDVIKREFCERNGIPLILIPFSFDTQSLVSAMLEACFKELGIV